MAPNWAGSDEHQRRDGGLVESDAGNNEKFSRANREKQGKGGKPQDNLSSLLLRRIYLIAAVEHNLG